MYALIGWLRLFRFPNLIMIGAGQLLVRYCLILPAFRAEYFITGEFPPHLSTAEFYLVVASTLLIAAGGYLINDYFDINIDEINKPGKNKIGVIIAPVAARKVYFVLTAIGVACGLFIGIRISKPVIGFIPLFSAISLWMYSSFYKRRLFTGNFIIAILTALSLLIVGLFEPEFYRNFNYLLWYAILAFLISLIRELIKDIEDIEGDELAQCKTVPIRLGIPASKKIIVVLIILTSAYIMNILVRNFSSNSVISLWYIAAFFIIPLAALGYMVITANEKKDFHYASLFSKLIMLEGIVSLIPFWYYFLT
jgi:4-hydroxybenzoate polyprenyltransferase